MNTWANREEENRTAVKGEPTVDYFSSSPAIAGDNIVVASEAEVQAFCPRRGGVYGS
jgi:hypothetical protein